MLVNDQCPASATSAFQTGGFASTKFCSMRVLPIAPMLWNVPVVASPSVPLGQALTIDTSFVTVLDREAPSVMLSNSHADYFVRNLVAILGELRAGLEVRDTGAVNKVAIDVVT